MSYNKNIIVYQIYEYFLEEASKARTSQFQDVLERASDATGLNKLAIKDALDKKITNCASTSQQEKRNPSQALRSKVFDIHLRNKVYQEIREAIMFLYTSLRCKTEMPTVDNVLVKLQEPMEKPQINEILKTLKYKRYQNIIIEKHSERLKRIKFFKKLHDLKRSGFKDFVYAYVTFLVSPTLTGIETSKGNKTANMYVVAFAAGNNGLVPGTLLLHKLDGLSDELICSFYETWLRDNLIPNIPVNSVLLIDEGIHKKMFRNSPQWFSSREEMINWLEDNHIQIDDKLFKPEIYEVIKHHKAHYFEYEYGVRVMYIQQYHPRLNPLNIIWEKVKTHVGILPSIVNVEDLTTNIFELITYLEDTDWQKAFYETLLYEQNVISNEKLIDERLEKIKLEFPLSSDPDYSTESDSES